MPAARRETRQSKYVRLSSLTEAACACQVARASQAGKPDVLSCRGERAARHRRGGMSLLEVILAMVILAGAVVVLGEVARLSMANASAARDLARAQMLCESKMTEITSGVTAPTAMPSTPFDSDTEPAVEDDPHWLFAIDSQQTDEEGLIAVRVTVTKDLPVEQHPVSFSLVRWMQDPNSTQSSSGTSGSNTNSSGGSSNGGS